MTREPFWYLATPYTKDKEGIDKAFKKACKASAFLVKNGIRIFSPIAHAHAIAINGGINPLDHDGWISAEIPMMEAAVGVIVVKMEG